METIYEELPVPLTQDEIRLKGGELAAMLSDYASVEEEKKSAAKELSDKLKDIRRRMDQLGREVRTGEELRQVPCYEDKDFASNTVRIVRRDTHEVVRIRPMRPDEHQESFGEMARN